MAGSALEWNFPDYVLAGLAVGQWVNTILALPFFAGSYYTSLAIVIGIQAIATPSICFFLRG